MSNDLWFRGMEFDGEEKPKRLKATETKAHYGFASKTGAKKVAALDSSNSSIGNGRFLKRTQR